MTTVPIHPTPAGLTSTPPAVVIALYAETPLHPGTGQSTGIVDLPVQRERHTGFPTIPATSLKGSLRQVAARQWENQAEIVNCLFGPEAQPGGILYAAALAFADARLVAFPVRSLSEVFLWATCPLVLSRLARDLRLAARVDALPGLIVPKPGPDEAVVVDDLSGTIVLEDLSFRATPNDEWRGLAAKLAGLLPSAEAHRVYREKFERHLVLIDDCSFGHLAQHATQVTARVALNEHKTTTGDGGNLWYEETLPADSLFSALVLPERPRVSSSAVASAADVRARFLELVRGDPFFLQVGGNETVGHGWCAVRVLGPEGGSRD